MNSRFEYFYMIHFNSQTGVFLIKKINTDIHSNISRKILGKKEKLKLTNLLKLLLLKTNDYFLLFRATFFFLSIFPIG
jgi:hypothetical protein